jgi:pimeloyl-ACP methyl ester carboxylesterase
MLWLSSQGILDGLVPEELIIRFMTPNVTSEVASAYAAPFSGPQSQQAVGRFAMTVPGMPDFSYWLFQSRLGVMVDGLCPQESFSSLHEQLRLREKDHAVREFWSSGEAETRVAVVFGRRDPLLRDYYDILMEGIRTREGVPHGVWIDSAGHYPVEEQSRKVAELIAEFTHSGDIPHPRTEK